ncbi:hypothetical protein MTR67_042969 [Solanum verrucosum]|uniref:Uncharacterized protein n=1 Tax=Solanum verrucosum TaxID=315347 RepID=A0AAF0UPE0_SOLVR|nr:hypothetical protein MTR67_042969 [Solanum verrucosum]
MPVSWLLIMTMDSKIIFDNVESPASVMMSRSLPVSVMMQRSLYASVMMLRSLPASVMMPRSLPTIAMMPRSLPTIAMMPRSLPVNVMILRMDYELAELTWENGQVVMHGLGPPRVPNKPLSSPSPTKYAWDNKPHAAAGGTLESIVNQATTGIPHHHNSPVDGVEIEGMMIS